MQVTVELPDHLAERVSAESERLGELLARALRPKTAEISPLRREVISFLGRGPRPDEIIRFLPSESASKRMSELLELNRKGGLSAAETAEMDEIEEIDSLVSLLKAEARKHLQRAFMGG